MSQLIMASKHKKPVCVDPSGVKVWLLLLFGKRICGLRESSLALVCLVNLFVVLACKPKDLSSAVVSTQTDSRSTTSNWLRSMRYLHALAFQITKPTGPVKVPLGVITKFIMANMEPTRANRMAKTTLLKVSSHSLKLTSSCWLPLSLAWSCD